MTALLLGRAGATRFFTPWISSQEAATSILVYGKVVEHLRVSPTTRSTMPVCTTLRNVAFSM
jgi:hypothetical protein